MMHLNDVLLNFASKTLFPLLRNRPCINGALELTLGIKDLKI